MNFSKATLTKMLNSLSALTVTAIPVVPILVNKISFCSGLHRLDNSTCSSSEMNFVSSKLSSPELKFLTEINGMPLSIYFGVRWVPSVIKVQTVPSLTHSHPAGNAYGTSSGLIGGSGSCFLIFPSLISFFFSTSISFSSSLAGGSLGSCGTSFPCIASDHFPQFFDAVRRFDRNVKIAFDPIHHCRPRSAWASSCFSRSRVAISCRLSSSYSRNSSSGSPASSSTTCGFLKSRL